MAPLKHLRSPAAAVGFIAVLALIFLVWPMWRAQFPLEINGNEGWNAYYADRAFSDVPFYPRPKGLIGLNYPPLSFFFIASLTHLGGDALYVGRVLSGVATVALGLIAAGIVRQFNVGRLATALTGVWFVAIMARSFDGYVAMNDPHLLALAIMATGFLWFLARMSRGRAVEPAVLLMVFAGFFKHNIIALPLVAAIWLSVHDWRKGIRATVVGVAAAGVGLGVSVIAFGPNFLPNLLAPRTLDFGRSLDSVGRLQFVLPALAIWAIWAWIRRGERNARFSMLFIGVSLTSYLLQKAGTGVAENAQFELVLATAIGIGMAFNEPATLNWPLMRTVRDARLVIVAVLAIRLLASLNFEFAYVIFSSSYRAEAASLSRLAHEEAERVAKLPAPVSCSLMIVCRAAGQPFVIHGFHVVMMVATGALSQTAVDAEIRAKHIRFVTVDPRLTAKSLQRRYRANL